GCVNSNVKVTFVTTGESLLSEPLPIPQQGRLTTTRLTPHKPHTTRHHRIKPAHHRPERYIRLDTRHEPQHPHQQPAMTIKRDRVLHRTREPDQLVLPPAAPHITRVPLHHRRPRQSPMPGVVVDLKQPRPRLFGGDRR